MRVLSPTIPLIAILAGFIPTPYTSCGQQAYRAIVLSDPTFPPPFVGGMRFGVVFGAIQSIDGPSKGAVWDLSSATVSVKNPASLFGSSVIGVYGENPQIAGPTLNPPRRDAFLDSSGAVVDFLPPGEYDNVGLAGANLGVQFGWVRSIPAHQTIENPYGVNHASIWRGGPSSFVDLHDGRRLHESWVNAASVGTQVGIGTIGDGSIEHAVMWRGSARTLVDLHPPSSLGSAYPPPFEESQAWAVDGNSVVGMAMFKAAGAQPVPHAILWNGSETNWVDLHPAGFVGSYARGINRETQAGYAYRGKTRHAMVWHGRPESALDLHTFLEERTTAFSYSVALAIDEFGNVAGRAGYLENPGPSERTIESVVVWTPRIEGSTPSLSVAPAADTGGWVLLQLSGLEGKTYRVESSLDLSNWGEFKTLKTETGLLFFKIPPEAQPMYQFFRAIALD